jgi:hypothetical protein
MNGTADDFYRSRIPGNLQRQRISCILHWQPISIGVSPGNRGPLVPRSRVVASVDEAKALESPAGYRPWIEASGGYRIYAFAGWQFVAHQRAASVAWMS